MQIVLLDDCGFHWEGVEPSAPLSTIQADDLARWFWLWALERRNADAWGTDGLFLIHAHGRFTSGAHRQDLQGIELLKHIRLTPWLGTVSTWHAIVYSFEPLEQILSRKRGNLILTSPGVTFLRLPAALALRNALVHACPQKEWSSLPLTKILAGLAKENPTPNDHSFRPHVASDYRPPDSAHETSNLWGLYEMWPTCLDEKFPEVDAAEKLPPKVLGYVLSLTSKKARWLEGERARTGGAASKTALHSLPVACKNKRLVLVDDEAGTGWGRFLRLLMNGGAEGGTDGSLWMPDPAQLRELRRLLTLKKDLANSLEGLAQQVHQEKPDLVVLDLRLCGSAEFATPAAKSTGMELARRLRVLAPFLPILLFTASNKAETLLISNSYDVDEYWLKPGLGEHRGLGSREADITSLADKIERLLGPDYCWLQRMAQELSIIKTATAQAWWWERDIRWPNPVRPDGKAINGLQPNVIAAIKQQPSLPEIRTSVIELLRPILESFRIALRLEQRDSSVPAPLAPHLLRAGVFNQIGKIVELIHGFTDRSAVPDEFQKAGTVGGRKDVKDDCFVFFRQDWLAFRLFSQRNEWSHVRLIDQANVFAPLNKRNVKAPSKVDVVKAMSDLVAWLTVPRLKPRKTEVAGPDGERFRLSPEDSLAPEVRSWTRLSSRAAASSSFRACLVGRPEYGPFVVKSQELLQCFHQERK